MRYLQLLISSFLFLNSLLCIYAQSNCTTLSSKDTDSYWDAVGKCSECNLKSDCGFCLSTLQCLEGTDVGPLDGIPCPSWTFQKETCPLIPTCDASDCHTCALKDECAWCASENLCTTISEAFSKDCRGLVFEPPCPQNYVTGIDNRTLFFNMIMIFDIIYER